MQTITRPFWHRTDEELHAPAAVRRKKSHWSIRILVFLLAIALGWIVAMAVHETITWLHHPSDTGKAQLGSFIARGIEFLRGIFTN